MRKTAKNMAKKITAWALVSSMGLGLIPVAELSGTMRVQAAETGQKTESPQQNLSAAEGGYDYGRAWQQTLMFYEFQKSGLISQDDPSCNRNNWKGDCEWNDGQEIDTEPLYRIDGTAKLSETKTWTEEDGAYWDPEEDGTLDLTGGWHDAGDHVKFNLPMAYASGMLAWSYLEYKDIYEKTGQDKYALNEIRWVNDYLIKCHAKENVYFYQVGDGDVDHQFWGSPELIDEPGVREIQMPKISRPCYWVNNTAEHGGSAVCADSAASLAAASMIYKDTDPEYSATCLEHARGLYQMALDAQSDVGYMEHGQGYYSSTHFEDELSWGGVWLYKATGEREYLDTALSYDHKWGGTEMVGDLRGHVWTQCWDDVRYGAMLLMAEEDDGEKGQECRTGIEYNLDYWSSGVREDDGTAEGRPARGKYTPRGLVMINDWGSVRYAGAEAAMAMFYCKWKDADPNRVEKYKEFAKSQADYILGSSGRNFIVGYNDASPRNPHHRTADGAWKNSPLKCPTVSRHTLVGAIVGGPDGSETYDDNRNNYCTNEVANDYNIGPMCLMAAMYEEYGGTIDPDMNAYEEVGEEYYMDGCNCTQGKDNDGRSFCEVKLRVENHTGWPSRPSRGLKFRYFVNIKDAKYVSDPVVYEGDPNYDAQKEAPSRIGTPVKAEDFEVISYYTQRKSLITNLIPWNEEEGIYYVEVAFGWDEDQMAEYEKKGIKYQKVGEADSYIYPGGDVECRADMQLLVRSPMGSDWDYTNNFSYIEIKDTEVDERKKIQNIPLYEDDKLVGGIEPAKTGPVDLTIPDVAVDDISIGTADSAGTVQQSINFDLGIGETLNPSENIIFNPSNATDKTLTWQSMNTNVATVEADGTITGVGKGSTSIIVWANGGGKPANLVVNVDGGAEDLYSAKVLGNEITWTPPEIIVGPKVTDSASGPVQPSSKPSIDPSTIRPSAAPSRGSSAGKPSGSEKPSASEGSSTSVPSASEVSEPSTPSESGSIGSISKPAGSEPSESSIPSGNESENNPEYDPSKEPSESRPSINEPTSEPASTPGTSEPSERPSDNGSGSKPSTAPSDPQKPSIGEDPSDGNEETPASVIFVQFKNPSVSLKVGKTQKLEYTILPENAENKQVTFKSERPNVATVDRDGVVTAISVGTTVITMTTADGEKTDTCTIKVEPAVTDVTGIVLNEKEKTLEVGEPFQITAMVLPESATNKTVTYISSKPEIAEVDQNGQVTTKKAGDAVITATTEDGGYSAQCRITVKEKPAEEKKVEKILLDRTDYTMTVGDTYTLTATVLPTDADQTLVWTSEDSDIVSVQNGVLKAGKSGTAKVTVISASNPQVQQICTVTVKEKEQAVTGIKVNKSSISLTVSGKYVLKTSPVPSGVTNKEMTFKSNSSIVKVTSKNGITATLQAKAPGIATITVISKANSSVKKKVTVKVSPAQVASLKKKAVASNKVSLTFHSQKGISGYEVQYCDPKTKKYKVYKRIKSTKVTVTRLKAKTSYKFRVRAYKTVSGKRMYGKYSKTLTVKTK